MPKTSGSIISNKYKELGLSDTYYLFGTDNLGRDLFSRCFMGLRVSLIIALVATAINLIIGMNYGMISGYFGGLTDIIMQRIVDIIGSIPTLVVVTLLMIVLEPGMGSIIFALMLSGWFEMSLIARSEVLKVKQLEYVQASRTMGAGHLHHIPRYRTEHCRKARYADNAEHTCRSLSGSVPELCGTGNACRHLFSRHTAFGRLL